MLWTSENSITLTTSFTKTSQQLFIEIAISNNIDHSVGELSRKNNDAFVTLRGVMEAEAEIGIMWHKPMSRVCQCRKIQVQIGTAEIGSSSYLVLGTRGERLDRHPNRGRPGDVPHPPAQNILSNT